MSLAFVFPGQGSQSVGMAMGLVDRSPAAAAVFAELDAVLGEPISALVRSGPAETLDLTVNAQPTILGASIAYLRALEETSAAGEPARRPAFYAGHSMGQYSAMVAAGVLTLADAARLVRERGRLMQASSEGGAMAAVIGLADERIGDLLEAGRVGGVLTVANRNSPGQIVISGEPAAVDAAVAAAKGLGAKRALPLPVSVAAHSPLMARAAEGLRAVLAGVRFSDPAAPLLSNAEARPLRSGAECRDELVEHLTRGVDWVAAVERMHGEGVVRFVEVGPGRVLTGLIRRIVPDAEAVALDDPAAPGGLAIPTATAVASA